MERGRRRSGRLIERKQDGNITHTGDVPSPEIAHGQYEPMSEEELRIVRLVDAYLAQTIRDLGIEDVEDFSGQRIYNDSKLQPHDFGAYGHYFDTIIMNPLLIRNAVWQFVSVVFHERIHQQTLLRLDAEMDGDKADDLPLHTGRKFGFARYSADAKGEYSHFHEPRNKPHYLDGIVEAITEKMALETTVDFFKEHPTVDPSAADDAIFQNLQKESQETITEGQKDTEEDYYNMIRILNTVLGRIADYRQEPVSETWKRWKRSLFTGEMMHMRDVDAVFGPGSLRFLGALSTIDNRQNMRPSMDYFAQIDAAREYFSTTDHAAHKKIIDRSLKRSERQRWLEVNGYFKKKNAAGSTQGQA